MIELIDFTRKYGNFTAVDKINLTLEPGKIHGLLGPNGAGKSTTVKAITGAIKPTSGTILVNKLDILEHNHTIKALIGYVPENPVIFKNLTGREFLDFSGRLYHIPPSTLRIRIEELMMRFGIAEKANDQVFSYSKGTIQKLMIVSSLLHNPEILILDEPLTGLDANAAALVKKTIRSFADRGKTILFCSHILEVVEKLCDSIAILHTGSILSAGTSREIMEQTNTGSLEEAFISLTGQSDMDKEAADIISALG